MSNVKWIAAYPRSGSTWLRFLLTHVATGRVDSWLDVERTVPDLHEQKTADRIPDSGAVILKTHYPYSAQHPYIDYTRSAVVLIRHPLDIIVSVANFVCRQTGLHSDDVPAAIERFATMFADTGGVFYGDFWSSLGKWEDNVRSWIDQNEFPTLLVRYEDLLRRPRRELKAICRFLMLPDERARIAHALRDCALDRMVDMEKRHVEWRLKGEFFDASEQYRRPHVVYRGKANHWRKAISNEMLAIVGQRQGASLTRLGYKL